MVSAARRRRHRALVASVGRSKKILDSKTAVRELIRVSLEYRRAALESICPEGICYE